MSNTRLKRLARNVRRDQDLLNAVTRYAALADSPAAATVGGEGKAKAKATRRGRRSGREAPAPKPAPKPTPKKAKGQREANGAEGVKSRKPKQHSLKDLS